VKIVLDTNVFVSGIFFNGPPYQILKAWNEGKIQLVVSLEILDEYRRVGEILAEEHPEINIQPILDYVYQNADTCDTPPRYESICEDPDDDKFLACALESGSKVIVSDDKHLLKVSGYREIEVLNPRDFLNKFLNTH
jgi:uncharacterized protein